MFPKKIYLDLDGVLVNFLGAVFSTTGYHWGQISSSKMWKLIAAENPRIFLNADPMCYAEKLVQFVQQFAADRNLEIEILTAIPVGKLLPTAADDKRNWVYNHFPNLNYGFNIGPLASDKFKFAKAGDILIDDSHLNIRDWNKSGGIGIHHVSADSTIDRLKTVGYRLMKLFG